MVTQTLSRLVQNWLSSRHCIDWYWVDIRSRHKEPVITIGDKPRPHGAHPYTGIGPRPTPMGLQSIAPHTLRECFRIRMLPDWGLVQKTSELIAAYFDSRLSGRSGERFAVAAHELLEGAARYCPPREEIDLQVLTDPDVSWVEIRVTHEAVASRVTMLEKAVHQVMGFEDPKDALLDAMRKASAPGDASFMLSFARIRHEARLDVSALVQDRKITVIAKGAT